MTDRGSWTKLLSNTGPVVMAPDLAPAMPPEPAPKTRLQQLALGLLIWIAFAVVGGAALYGLSILAGD
jgi:hypothetical protein